MAKKLLTHLNLNLNELQNAVIQQLSSAPSSPVQGQIYYNTTDDNLYIYDGSDWVDLTLGGSGTGDVTGPASSVDNEIVLFNSTTGKLIKRATLTGLVKAASGVASAAVAGTDYTSPSSTEAFTNKTFDANGSGNSISNLETADFATNVVDNDSTLAANSSSRFATQQAVKGYVDNSVQGLSWKQAVRVATTANGTLASAFENGDTVDGVTIATGDRILIKDQSTASENGIYTVNASGAPTRASDANSGAELRAATVYVEEGTANADTVWNQTVNATITVGSTGLTFAQVNGGSVPQATTSVQGKVELATAGEAEARTDADRAVTPLALANFPVKKTFTIGDNSATQIDVTHSLGTKEVITQVRQASDDAVVECDITNFSTSVVRLNFAVAPATNALKVVVLG
jgi:hypothetical protein